MARLVIVSNRVPIPKARGASAGGLAVALRDLLTPGTMWFGWSGRLSAEPSLQPAIVEARGVTYATVDITAEAHRGFYVGFANGALWPLLHFRLGLMHFRREDYDGYLEVNRTFARSLASILQQDDTVWAHDYHLIPFARLLREQGFNGRLGFFLHVPFVPPSMLEAMPVARDLVADLCAYDLVGFQTEEHARDFRDCAQRMLGAAVEGEWIRLNGRRLRAFADPIGIDAAGFAQEAERAAGEKLVQRVAGSLSGRALAIGVDRMDYSKGLPHRFEAFGRLLEKHPEHKRQIHFLQICPRSREEVDEYRKLRIELDRLAGRINGRHSDFDWTPLRYSTRAAPRATLAGLYRIGRIGVVTPLRDGMNLVAKEFIAAQSDEDPGVLVLSQFAGAAQDLTEALIVNPFDPDAIADAMHMALAMPPSERKERHLILKEKVMRTTAETYCRRFIEALEAPSIARAAA
ncbi:MAG: trehalose-6-phosphate synthase [Reyranella sp.]|jgi:trehalose 6-phosphate synthase|uniref:alpha,alpha-trehalose-phosphate synthase (UDP-forming) n=1 Tax=Reyranella sp. TaxID=1929291 RepID=UPI00096340D8|nr:trehalose-6-phosphate synthase [Reyranella sp.]MBN9538763.1 trehalose-6-phosphate synthase [Alphaproteobacteria bacterium]MBR2814036.1 trehalose-6-phosphate synthase [Reyranella sp.]OJU33589.1 MAG: trehalose-6-phosphate synthase [Alphaproteobacteria bacterium 65-37]